MALKDLRSIPDPENPGTIVYKYSDDEFLQSVLNKSMNWIISKNSFVFFKSLLLSTNVAVLTSRYMELFYASDVIVTDGCEIFLSEKFLAGFTGKQIGYVLLNCIQQLGHLHPFRLLPMVDEKTTAFSYIPLPTRLACVNSAAMLWVNHELNKFLSNYYTVLEGCDHLMGTIQVDNYHFYLGYEQSSDLPDIIAKNKIIDLLENSTTEYLAKLFLLNYNKDNPPQSKMPMWALASQDGHNIELSSEERLSLTKQLIRQATTEAQRVKGAGGDVFCPFELDDLHFTNNRINYKHLLSRFVSPRVTDDWNGYDRRNLQGISPNYKFMTGGDAFSSVIYVDVSGSLIGFVKEVLGEVQALVHSGGDAQVKLRYFSNEIQDDDVEKIITPYDDVSSWNLPEYTGGTCFTPIKEDVEKNFPDSHIIIITDGFFFDEVDDIETIGEKLIVFTQNYNKEIEDDVNKGRINYQLGFSDIND